MMTKKIISIIVAIILVIGMSVTAFANDSGRYVFDDASILTYDEIEEFESTANSLYQEYGCEVYIITFESLMGYEAWELNELLYDELVSEYGAGDDVIMLLLSMEERQYDIMAHGYGNTVFTDYGKDVMAEKFLDDFAIDDWYWGFSDYLDTCGEFLEMAANGEPFDVYSDDGDDFITNAIGVIVATAVSCLIALGICLIFKAQMKTAIAATQAKDYEKDLVLTNQYDIFSHRDIKRVYNPPQEENEGGTTVNSSGSSHKSGGF